MLFFTIFIICFVIIFHGNGDHGSKYGGTTHPKAFGLTVILANHHFFKISKHFKNRYVGNMGLFINYINFQYKFVLVLLKIVCEKCS